MDDIYQKYKPILSNYSDISVNLGWMSLLEQMLDEISATGLHIQIRQIKSKFATLRVYCDNTSVDDIVLKYANIASNTCEICGEPGKYRCNGGWETIMCDTCQNDRIKSDSSDESRDESSDSEDSDYEASERDYNSILTMISDMMSVVWGRDL